MASKCSVGAVHRTSAVEFAVRHVAAPGVSLLSVLRSDAARFDCLRKKCRASCKTFEPSNRKLDTAHPPLVAHRDILRCRTNLEQSGRSHQPHDAAGFKGTRPSTRMTITGSRSSSFAAGKGFRMLSRRLLNARAQESGSISFQCWFCSNMGVSAPLDPLRAGVPACPQAETLDELCTLSPMDADRCSRLSSESTVVIQ